MKNRDFLSDLKIKYLYPINSLFHLTFNSIYDFYKNLFFTSFVFNSNHRRTKSLVIVEAHRIEKALTLKSERNNFSIRPIRRLMYFFKKTSNLTIKKYIVNVFNNIINECPQHVKYKELKEFVLSSKIHEANEFSKTFIAPKLVNTDKINFLELANIRRSIRYFTNDQILLSNFISNDDIQNVTPSVCNRRDFRFIQITDENTKMKLLKLQNGNGSFRDHISNLAIVVADPSKMINPEERNQYFIDGGLFGMNFLHFLTYYGISSCCLNWSRNMIADLKFKNLNVIKKHEELLFMVAFGYMDEKVKATKAFHKL
jgi:nitroreductase